MSVEKYIVRDVDANTGADVITIDLDAVRKDYKGIVVTSNMDEAQIAAAIQQWEDKEAEKSMLARSGGKVKLETVSGVREYSYLKQGASQRPAEKIEDLLGVVTDFRATKDSGGKDTAAGTVEVTCYTQMADGSIKESVFSRYLTADTAAWFPHAIGDVVSVKGTKQIAHVTTFLGTLAAGETMPTDAEVSELNNKKSIVCFHAGTSTVFTANLVKEAGKVKGFEKTRAAFEAQEELAREQARLRAKAKSQGEQMSSVVGGLQGLQSFNLSGDHFVALATKLIDKLA